ncbi:MAG: pyridoxamine 5'-phosphate oxidase family protein [Dehalococcoidia bacterium]
MPISYHEGQLQVQTEANTRPIAEALRNWVGPVVEFCETADMIVLATPAVEPGDVRFLVASGSAPIVEIVGPTAALVRLDEDSTRLLDGETSCGGLAISMAVARRARLNGTLSPVGDGLLLEPAEVFTNCRKYVAPSEALSFAQHVGPTRRSALLLDDPWLAEVLARAETSFLGTVSPAGVVDVSHRGGEPGFLEFEAANARLSWDEYVGDGMFKSAGNIRAGGRFTLLVLDLASGDAAELHGTAGYETLRTAKQARTDGLEQHPDHFPVQGRMSCRVEAAYRLDALTHPRRRLERRQRVTSCSTTDEQAPQ